MPNDRITKSHQILYRNHNTFSFLCNQRKKCDDSIFVIRPDKIKFKLVDYGSFCAHSILTDFLAYFFFVHPNDFH